MDTTTDHAAPSLLASLLTGLFAAIGVVATLGALLFWSLTAAMDSGDGPADGARDDFVAYADTMDGVATATASVASSNSQQPFNVDAMVTLGDGCTLPSLERSVATVQRRLSPDSEVQVHPIVACGDLAVQVSVRQEVTTERMAALRSLIALPDATGAAVTYPTPGFDRFVDDRNDTVTLSVGVKTRDALVPTVVGLRAHPPIGIGVPNVVVRVGTAVVEDFAGTRDSAGPGETKVSVSASTPTLAQLLSVVDEIAATSAPYVSASASAAGTSVSVTAATPEQARTVESALAASGADISRLSLDVSVSG